MKGFIKILLLLCALSLAKAKPVPETFVTSGRFGTDKTGTKERTRRIGTMKKRTRRLGTKIGMKKRTRRIGTKKRMRKFGLRMMRTSNGLKIVT